MLQKSRVMPGQSHDWAAACGRTAVQPKHTMAIRDQPYQQRMASSGASLVVGSQPPFCFPCGYDLASILTDKGADWHRLLGTHRPALASTDNLYGRCEATLCDPAGTGRRTGARRTTLKERVQLLPISLCLLAQSRQQYC